MFLRLARFPLCTTKYRTLEVRLNGFRKQGNDVKVKHAENPKHEILNPKQITSTKLEIPNDYLKFVIWNLFRISIFGFRIYSDFKSAMTSSTERSGTYGRSPPSGSSILRLTRASFFMPTTRKMVRMAFAVWPERPMTFPMSSLLTESVRSTPISSTTRLILTSLGLSTNALTTYSRNC